MVEVIYRVHPESKRMHRSLVAVFPLEPGTNDPATCLCLDSADGHSSCDAKAIMAMTLPLREGADLERMRGHVRSIYGETRERTKLSAKAQLIREAKIRKSCK